MSLMASLAMVCGGAALLYLGAEWLVRGSAGLALRFHVSPLLVGLTVVALGTSAPELVVCLEAAVRGEGEIAVGTVVGSNIANFGLILGLAAIIYPLALRPRLVHAGMPVVIACSLLLVTLLLDGRLTRIEALVLVLGFLAYLTRSVREGVRQGPAPPVRDGKSVRAKRTLLCCLLVVAGLASLIVGADLLLSGAVAAARWLGVSDAVVGLTIVAVGSSLPELATSAVAAARRQSDIAVGNIVGSNIFNILGILGLTALIRPLRSDGVELSDLLVMAGTAILMTGLMWTGYRVRRWEGLLMLGLYAAYIYHLI